MNQEGDILVRRADSADIDAMHTVYRETWLQTYPSESEGITFEDIDTYLREVMLTDAERTRRIALLQSRQPTVRQWVALSNERVVGVCGAIKTDEYNQLKSLYVLPQFQGIGIGTLLWNEAREWFDPDKKIIVHTATYIERTIAFYKKLGFVDTGKRFREERFRMKSGALIPEMEMVIEL